IPADQIQGFLRHLNILWANDRYGLFSHDLLLLRVLGSTSCDRPEELCPCRQEYTSINGGQMRADISGIVTPLDPRIRDLFLLLSYHFDRS
ncbi:MAG TPA: hypothetical protein VGM23_09830, partial [Armatimonadota bacterium]